MRERQKDLAQAIGRALRKQRQSRGWTLDEVRDRSNQQFTASVLGGYERAERSISVERFIDLSLMYGIPPDRLLGDVLKEIASNQAGSVVIDLTRMSSVPGPTRDPLTEAIERVRIQRGDFLSEVITLRSGDIERVALTSDIDIEKVKKDIEPALRRPPRG